MIRISLLLSCLFASALICAPSFPAVREPPDSLPVEEEGVIVIEGRVGSTPVHELPGKTQKEGDYVLELEEAGDTDGEELIVVEETVEEEAEIEAAAEVIPEEEVEEPASPDPVVEDQGGAGEAVEVEAGAEMISSGGEALSEEIPAGEPPPAEGGEEEAGLDIAPATDSVSGPGEEAEAPEEPVPGEEAVEEAEVVVEEAEEDPRPPAAQEPIDKLLAEGELLLELGQVEEARTIFSDVLTLDPENEAAAAYLEEIPEVLEAESAVFEEVEAVEEGESAEIVVVGEEKPQHERPEDIPTSPRLRLHYFYNRGLEAFESGDYPEAIHAFEEVQKIDVTYRRADYYRRQAWDRIAEDQWAREYMDELALARTMDQMSYDAYSRGREYMRYGKYEAAIEELQKVLDVDPDHQAARELMDEARLNLEKKSFEEEVAAAELLAADEIQVREETMEEEAMAVREDYYEGEQLFREGEYEAARRSFTGLEEDRGRHRRSSFYLRKIDRELWEDKEAERVDFEAEAIRKYTLGPEDAVRVVVRNHPEFDFEAEIEEGGELVIPLTNEIIPADGLTRDELAETIRQYLTAYIDNPFVNIFITSYGSKKYYVLQPKGGGSEYIMDKASMTLWDVMFRAGLPMLDAAAMRRIQVITPHKTHPTHRWINVYAMLYQGKMEDNIRIEPGTIIYYPMLVIDKFEMTMKAITRPLKAMVDFQSDYDSWDDWRKEHLR